MTATMSLDGPASTLITGGSKGIGRAIAHELAEPGRTLVINYAHDDAAGNSTKAELEDQGAKVILAKGDVADATFRAELAALVRSEVGDLGQLVHCAVKGVTTVFEDLDHEVFEEAVIMNGATLPLTVHALRESLVSGSSVVFLSSIGAKLTIPGYMALGAPKAMAESFVRYLAVELAPRGVRVNTVSCSSLMTDAFRAAVPNAQERYDEIGRTNPSGRNITFEEVAAAVRFLSSTSARMITGKETVIDGGLYSRLF